MQSSFARRACLRPHRPRISNSSMQTRYAANRIMRWDEETGRVSVYRKPSNNANGNCRDRQGRLLSCEHDTRRITRTEYDGSITVLMDRFDGKRLNSPNDITVKSDDTVWFSDPPIGLASNYQGTKATPELPAN